ncbi:MAG TPA: hypothetical protein VFV34_19055 [Blastocatellia bacterium]|nr:hypothetical protein [Blastocatellia bacterium]
MKLTEACATKISSLRYDPEAEIIYCPLPLGSIYFSDEVPDDLIPEDAPDGLSPETVRDFMQVMEVLGVRVNLWNSYELSAEEQALWTEARQRFPEWPIFQRPELTLEQRKEHESILEDVGSWFGSLGASDHNS